MKMENGNTNKLIFNVITIQRNTRNRQPITVIKRIENSVNKKNFSTKSIGKIHERRNTYLNVADSKHIQLTITN